MPTQQEFRRLVAVVGGQGKYGPRNRMAFMLSYLVGMRVGEIASLRWSDLLDGEGEVRDQLRLSAAVTKGGHARVVFLNARLRREVERYRDGLLLTPTLLQPVLVTQRRRAFSANVLTRLMKGFYMQAGLDVGSSHSGRRWFIKHRAEARWSTQLDPSPTSAKARCCAFAWLKYLRLSPRSDKERGECCGLSIS